MLVVFIYGPVASGKLTVAKELARLTGLPLFHNHLAIDLALSLFEFGTPGFVDLRERVWLDTFEAAARANRSFIFTFAPEQTVRPGLIDDLVAVVRSHGGDVHFVQLTCSEDTVEQRLGDESRTKFGKLTGIEQYRELKAAGQFEFPPLPPARVTIPTDEVGPAEAAGRIVAALALNS